jgi:predicted ABC-type ATPase
MADTTGYVKVDPDEVKDRLPEFALAVANSDKLAAARAHEESSTAIAEKIKDRAIEGGYNVMLDGTGKNGKKYLAMVQRLKERGYEVRVIMPHISVAEGVMAAEKRAHRSGRFVPLDFIRQAYEVIPHNFEQVARLADSAVLADAEPDRLGARSMSTIQRWENGRIVEEDQSKSRAYKQQFFGGNAPR